MTSRWVYGAAWIALALFMVVANLYVALVIGEIGCTGEGHPPPEAGSPRAGFCNVFDGHPDARVQALVGMLSYAPTLIALVGGLVALVKRSPRALRVTALTSVAWLLTLLLPLLLPSS